MDLSISSSASVFIYYVDIFIYMTLISDFMMLNI